MWSLQTMVVEFEDQARNGPTLPAGVVILSYCEKSPPIVINP